MLQKPGNKRGTGRKGEQVRMSIYTKTGDKGKTMLQDGVPIPKHHVIIQALAALDELNSYIGIVKSQQPSEELDAIQKNLMTATSLLSTKSSKAAHFYPQGLEEYFSEETKKLEAKIDEINSIMPEIKSFVTYGTCPQSAALDLARAITRRAETQLSQAAEKSDYAKAAFPYINRLSDYLYTKARYADFVYNVTQEVQKALNLPPHETDGLTLNKAKHLLEQIEHEAHKTHLPIVAAICNAAGNPVAVHVMDNALLISYEAAIAKAYTAAALKMPTSAVSKLVQPGQPFYGLESIGGGKIVPIGGGVPLFNNQGQLIGAIGVSGGTAEQDEKLAKGALHASI